MKILNFGTLNYDYVYSVPHIVAGGETISSKSMEVHFGGKGLNQSIAIARAGSEVWHAGAIGYDGNRFIELCKKNKVHEEYIRRIDGPSGNAFIQVDEDGENCIVLYGGANRTQSREHIDEVISKFDKGDLLILQNEINELAYIIEQAYKRGMRILLNPSPYDIQIDECDLSKVEYFMMNEVEGGQIAGVSDENQILDCTLKKYPDAKVVLTLGSKGAIYQDNTQKIIQKAIKVDAVDTTAAGDTFTGYFVNGIAKNLPIKECMALATKAAAVAVSIKGAVDSIPYYKNLV